MHVIADPATEPRPRIVPQLDDRELVGRLRQGDLGALEIIYQRYARPISQRRRRASHDRAAAWAATRQTFIALLAGLPCQGMESTRDRLLGAAARITAESSGEAARP